MKKIVATVSVAALAALGPTAMMRAGALTTDAAVETVAVTADSAAATAETVVAADSVAADAAAGDTAAAEATGEASSGGDKVELTEAAKECIELLEKGEPIDNCQKAPSPILPPTGELIAGSLAFLIVFLGLWKFAIPALKKTMAARSAKIEGDLNAAAKAKSDAESEGATYRAKIGDAKAEGDKLIDEARAQADATRRDLIARAEADAAEIRTKAAEESAAQSTRLKGELEAHVKRMSVDLAEKVVGANLNRETNNALVDRYIAELGAK